MAAEYNFTLTKACDKGGYFTRSFIWKDCTGTPKNLTDYKARMKVRKTASSSAVLVELTTENSRIALGTTDGTIQLTILSSVTGLFAPGAYTYDLYMIPPNVTGQDKKLMYGDFTVTTEVARPS